MLVHTKAKLIAATASCAVLCGGIVSVAVLNAQPPAKSPPASQPAAVTAAATTVAEPKQVLRDFADAFRRGDGEKVVALTIPKTDDERRLMDLAGAFSLACADMQKTVSEKFGPESAREFVTLYELTPLGRFVLIVETTLDNAELEIDGDVARVQPADQPDLTLWLEKHDGQWRLASGRITESWTADQWRERLDQVKQAIEMLNVSAAAINSGKYTSFAEVRRDLAPVLRQNR